MCASIMDRGWMIIALCVSSFCFSDAQGPTAKFSNITVQGIVKTTRLGRDVDSFMSIPYAEPPIGPLRFSDPTPKVHPDGSTLIADKPPIRCLQSIASVIGDGNSTRDLKGAEDCLYLNVYRPASIGDQSLPVMVYFQAADLFPGTDDISHIGPDYLLDKDIILVTLTYRLGVFGFLSTGDETAPGNFGLKDQKLALEWVQSNIADFGGDSNRVTLFGQGEAAKLIHIHALVNHTAGLFHRYILQSGTALAPWAVHYSQNSTLWTEKLATLNGCSTDSSLSIVDCLRMIDSRHLLELSYKPFSPINIGFYQMWGPIKEPISPRAFLTDCPEDLITRGGQRDLPFIAGITVFENTFRQSVLQGHSTSANFADEDWWEQNILSILKVFHEIFGFSDLYYRVTMFYAVGNSIDDDPEKRGDPLLNFVFGLFKNFEFFLEDFFYSSPQVKMLEERRVNSRRPFYFYSFDYRGTFGTGDWLFNRHGAGAPSYGDDLLYLFYHDTSKFPHSRRYTMNERDYKILEIMVELWTSFATQGLPRSRHVKDWKPYDSEGSYLKIGSKKSSFTDLKSEYHLRRMRFWTNITLQTCD